MREESQHNPSFNHPISFPSFPNVIMDLISEISIPQDWLPWTEKKSTQRGKIKSGRCSSSSAFLPPCDENKRKKRKKRTKPFLQKPKCHLFNFKNSVTHQSFGDVFVCLVLGKNCWTLFWFLCFICFGHRVLVSFFLFLFFRRRRYSCRTFRTTIRHLP